MSPHVHKLDARASPRVNVTFNELPRQARERSIEALNHLLVEVLDVALCARHAHWNARGPSFIALHELFDRIGQTLQRQADDLAERIGALGGEAQGTVQAITAQTSLKPYPVRVADGQDHVEAIAMRLGLLSAEARLLIHQCSGLGDPVTVDVLTTANAEIDHALWLVESHLVPHG